MTVLAGVCGVVGFGLYGQLAQNRRLDAQVTSLQAQNGQLERDIAQSQTEIVLAQTPAWLEEEARKLGYVLPGEKVYVLTTPGAAVPAGGGVSAPLPVLPTPTPTPTSSPTPAASPTPTAPPTFQLPSPSPHG
jgi:Septum formation initiator